MRTKKTFYNRPHTRVESKSFGPNPYVSYIFWDTEVVRFEQKTCKLTIRTGGYNTLTTRERINLALDDLNCPLRISAEKFVPVIWSPLSSISIPMPGTEITFAVKPGPTPEDWEIIGVLVAEGDVR